MEMGCLIYAEFRAPECCITRPRYAPPGFLVSYLLDKKLFRRISSTGERRDVSGFLSSVKGFPGVSAPLTLERTTQWATNANPN